MQARDLSPIIRSELSTISEFIKKEQWEEAFNLLLQRDPLHIKELALRKQWLMSKAAYFDHVGSVRDMRLIALELYGRCALQEGKHQQAFEFLLRQEVASFYLYDANAYALYQNIKQELIDKLKLQYDTPLLHAWDALDRNIPTLAYDVLGVLNESADNYEFYLLTALRISHRLGLDAYALRQLGLDHNCLMMKLADCRNKANDHQQAFDYLNRCCTENMSEMDFRRFQCTLANTLYCQGKFSQALAIYKTMHTEYQDSSIMRMIAVCYSKLGNHDEAKKMMMAKDHLLCSQANHALAEGDYQKALILFSTVEAESVLLLEALMGKAVAYRGLEQFRAAKKIYSEAVEKYPKSYKARSTQCEFLRVHFPKSEEAKERLQEARGLWPESSFLIGLGMFASLHDNTKNKQTNSHAATGNLSKHHGRRR